jgi:Asp/Glu/hydantoin racemase
VQTLTWLDATTGDPQLEALWVFLRDQVRQLVSDRMEVELRHVGLSSGGVRHPATRLLNDAGLLAAASQVEASSDAIVLGCWGSPVQRIRSAVGIPVASLPEASALAAAALARRAVVVTVADSLTRVLTEDLADYGGSGLHSNPVVSYVPESTHGDIVRAIHDPSDLIDRFDAAAAAAVEAGADAIVVGCGYLAPIFTAHGYRHVRGRPDIPVWDCNRLAVEHALTLHRLHGTGVRPAPLTYGRPRGASGEAFDQAVNDLHTVNHRARGVLA